MMVSRAGQATRDVVRSGQILDVFGQWEQQDLLLALFG